MRTFNSKEKEILKKMMAHPMLFKQGVLRPSVFLDSHYVGPNHKISLFFKSSENLVMLSFPKEGNESNEALLFIMVFFLLLRDLEKEGLLSCTGDSTDLNASLGSQYTEGNNVKLSANIAPIVCKYLVSFKSVYMRIFYDFFIAQIQMLLMSTEQQKSFLCENGPPNKLVGAQGTFLR